MRKLKLIVFDLDGTLAPVGGPIAECTRQQLRQLEEKNVQIALCSGKPVFYLCGVMRQVGLHRPILLGENGAAMQVGIDLPPREHYTLPYSRAAKESLTAIRQALDEVLPNLWYQPNQVGLTPFFRTQEENDTIAACIEHLGKRIVDVDIYPQGDCYDFTPTGISKAVGLQKLCAYLGVSVEETAAVGDGINDYPMFAAAGLSVGIGLKDPSLVDFNAADIAEALAYLRERI